MRGWFYEADAPREVDLESITIEGLGPSSDVHMKIEPLGSKSLIVDIARNELHLHVTMNTLLQYIIDVYGYSESFLDEEE